MLFQQLPRQLFGGEAALGAQRGGDACGFAGQRGGGNDAEHLPRVAARADAAARGENAVELLRDERFVRGLPHGTRISAAPSARARAGKNFPSEPAISKFGISFPSRVFHAFT